MSCNSCAIDAFEIKSNIFYYYLTFNSLKKTAKALLTSKKSWFSFKNCSVTINVRSEGDSIPFSFSFRLSKLISFRNSKFRNVLMSIKKSCSIWKVNRKLSSYQHQPISGKVHRCILEVLGLFQEGVSFNFGFLEMEGPYR